MLNKLKMMGGGVAGVGVAGVLGYGYMYGGGAFHVVAPETGAVSVSVDGSEVGSVPAGTHQRFTVEQGEHTVTLKASDGEPTQHSISVENGMYDDVLPLSGQCLVTFDVTNYWYEEHHLLDKLGDEVTVELKSTDGAAFDQPGGVYYCIDDFPMQIDEGARVELLVELPCEGLDVPDEELILAVFGGTAD